MGILEVIRDIELNKSTLRVCKVLKTFLAMSWLVSGIMGAWALLVFAINYLASF